MIRYMLAFILVGICTFFLILGMEDQYRFNQEKEIASCERDSWNTDHCQHLFKQLADKD